MPKLVVIKHPLDFTIKEVVDIPVGIPIDLVRTLPQVQKVIHPTEKVIVSRMGEIIPFEKQSNDIVHTDDYLLYMPMVGDDDVFSVLAVVGLYLIAGPAGTAMAGGPGFWATAATISIMVGGGMLISTLGSRPSLPSATIINADEYSQAYGWNPITTQKQGLRVPRVYGKMKYEGNLFEGFRQVTGDTTNLQTLYANIGIGEGPLHTPVIDGTFKLNDQDVATNFPDAYYSARYGDKNQEAVGWIPKCHFETSPYIRVTNTDGAKIHETVGLSFDSLQIDVSFPGGLYDGTGAALANHTVNITLEVKKPTANTWMNLVTEDITAALNTPVIRSYNTDGILVVTRGEKYQVRLAKNTTDKNDPLWGDILYLDTVREVTHEAFQHPMLSSVGVNALATNQLSGSLRFSAQCLGRYVRVYDGAWEIEYNNSFAWVIYDVLSQPVFTGAHSPWLDLKLMLNFEGDDAATETIDESPRGHSITFGGAAELDTAEKKFDTASLLLDGVDSFLQIANDGRSFNIFHNINENWTVDLFAKFADHTGNECIISQYKDADNRWFIRHLDGSGFEFTMRIGGVNIIEAHYFGEIVDTDWHHIALCKVGDEYGFYVDGTQVGYLQDTTTGIIDGDLFIGQWGGGGADYWFDGHLDHHRIVQNNIFSASPNVGLTDIITEPTAAYTDPGNSYVDDRHEAYADSKLDLSAFEALETWCDAARDNQNKVVISSISLAEKANIISQSRHNLTVGDKVLFHNVSVNGMIELVEETTAEVVQVISDISCSVNIDTSGYTAYSPNLKLLYHFEGVPTQGNLCLGRIGIFTINTSLRIGAWYQTVANVNDDNLATYVGFLGYSEGGVAPITGKFTVEIEFVASSLIDRIEYYRKYNVHNSAYEKVYLYYGGIWNLVNTENYGAGSSIDTVKVTSGAPWDNVTKAKIEIYGFTSSLDSGVILQYLLYELRVFGTIGDYDGDGAVEIFDSSPRGHDAGPDDFIGDAQIDTAKYKWNNSALLSDGTGDFIRLLPSEDWEIVENITDDWTIDLFAKFADHDGTEVLLAIESATDYWALQHVHGSGLQFLNKIGGVTKIDTGAAGEITDTDWYHIALCKVADEIGVYLDGIIKAHDTMIDGDKIVYNDDMTIMGRGASDPFQGHIDELRISKKNEFGAAPDGGLLDTIIVPTSQHSSGASAGTIEEYLPRFAFNGIIDIESDLWTTVNNLCRLCRCVPYMKGSKISIAINQAASPQYMFNMGNIEAGSFKEFFLPKNERAREITSQFRDKSKDFERDSSPVVNANITNISSRIKADRFGITDKTTVDYLSTFELLENQHINHGIQFRADVDAIPVVIGDVINFAHDVANWAVIGQLSQHYTGSGQILSAVNGTTVYITIAGQIKFTDADWNGGSTTYKITVKFNDDSMETETINGHTVSADGLHTILASGPFTGMPKPGDLWSAGQEDLQVKAFRVADMRTTSILKADLFLTEYAAACFAND